MQRKRLAILFGTRPEIIKMAPFIKTAIARHADFFIIHTGQHYSDIMDKVFWKNLALPDPKYNLGVGSGSHAEQVGTMMIGVERVLLEEKPDVVCVYADLNTSIAGAVAAAKLGIPIVQLEAGLRSFDRRMPEEVNRLVVDRLATHFFAPTDVQKENLRNEGTVANVRVVGNLIADAVAATLPQALRESTVLTRLGLAPKAYALATLHRAGAVDTKEIFGGMLEGLGRVARENNLPVIYPVHPRSRKNLERFALPIPDGVRITEPVDYFDFLTLEANARLILSDSGGIQEEAAILGVPLVTLRENTERPETLTLGSNMLAGFSPERIAAAAKEMLARPADWKHPYGERVAERMWDIMERDILR